MVLAKEDIKGRIEAVKSFAQSFDCLPEIRIRDFVADLKFKW